MLSQEQTETILAAWGRGNTVAAISKVIGVSERSIYKLLKQGRETKSCAARLSTRGRKPRLDTAELEALGRLIQNQPDITLREMQEQMDGGLRIGQFDRIVRVKLGYSFKNWWFSPANESAKTCSPGVGHGRRKCLQ